MRHRPSRALLAALCCAVALVTTGILAFHWSALRAHDAAASAGFVALSSRPHVNGAANFIASLVNPIPCIAAVLVLVAVALYRGRRLLAGVVPITMLGASGTSELLKRVVADARFSHWFASNNQIAAASWPSGHATAALTLGLCAVLVVPPFMRPLVAVLACALAVGVSYSILILRWHYPSDVVGGYLVAGMWISLAIGALWWGRERGLDESERDAETLGTRVLWPALIVLAVLVAGALAVVLEHTNLAAVHATVHNSLLAATIVIALVAALLAALVVLATRPAPLLTAGGSDPAPTATRRPGLPRARG